MNYYNKKNKKYKEIFTTSLTNIHKEQKIEKIVLTMTNK